MTKRSTIVSAGHRSRGHRRGRRGGGALAPASPGRRRRDVGAARRRTSDRSRPSTAPSSPCARRVRRAPLLLFSHGFSLDMTTWREQWPDLGDEFRCVALDHRAHGRSATCPSTGDVTLRSMGRDLATVLDAVAPDRPAVLIGHSMGAMAILALAEQRPDLFGTRIAGVVLLGASASDLLRGAMGGVTDFLRPRLGPSPRPPAAWTASGKRSSRAPATSPRSSLE